jgi:DNA primase
LITQQTIQQIQSRIDIIEVIGGFVRLKKRGVNYLGLCPFHNEKSPSFTVSPTKEIYKCFGCGKSGNTISFLMEHEKYGYVEALRWLANKYNVEVGETETSPEQKQLQQTAESLYIVNTFAQKFFSELLFSSDQGKDVGMSYLRERGFREDIIEKFQIGYSSNERDAFTKTALQAQFNPEILQKSGLSVLRDNVLVDNYRGRIIFPVHNQSGKIQGFGARVIGKTDRGPKYINTPENELYIKSKLLYGSYFARQAIDKNDECLLVEGYTDVVSLHQAGIENVVASGGTSLTPDQLRLIKKYTSNLTIIYDGDAAGIKAAMRGLDLALEEGLNVQLVLIPGGDDPDSYVSKLGPTKFKAFVAENRKDVILFQVEVSLKEAGSDTSRKAAVVNTIAETIARINKAEDFTRQQDYIKKSAALLNIEESGLTNLVNKHIREKLSRQDPRHPAPPPSSLNLNQSDQEDQDVLTLLQRDELHERALIRCLIEFGDKPWTEEINVAGHILEESAQYLLVEDPSLGSILDLYRENYNRGTILTEKDFLYHEDQQLNRIVVGLMDLSFDLSPNWKEHFEGKIFSREELYREEITSTINYLKLRKIKKMIEENQRDLDKNNAPTDQLILMMQTHQHLKQMEMELLRNLGTVILK